MFELGLEGGAARLNSALLEDSMILTGLLAGWLAATCEERIMRCLPISLLILARLYNDIGACP
jgi:hypothetical protein